MPKAKLKKLKMRPSLLTVEHIDPELEKLAPVEMSISAIEERLAFAKKKADEKALGKGKDYSALDGTGQNEKAAQKSVRSLNEKTDAGYYTVLVFDTGRQCDAFLKGLENKIPMEGALFLDGRYLADLLDIEIPEAEYKLCHNPVKNSRLEKLARRN